MPQSTTSEILTVADADRWAEVLEQIGSHDFCHLPAYSRLAELSGHGRAAMFVHGEGEHLLAFPLLFRAVDGDLGPGEGEPWSDVTSVYGYAGPLSRRPDVPDDVCERFMGWVSDCLRAERAVSALSRMHPLFPEQARLLRGAGAVAQVGWTLSVDLTLPEEQQTAAYRRNHRQDIRRLQTMGVTCEEVGVDRVQEFVSIYYENMDRVGASPEYYFSEEHFRGLLADMAGVAHLFMCSHAGRAVAAGIFTICRGICQWHLSGSRDDFDGPPPTKLMFDVARRWARANGARILHLGGGVGGSKDSLYHFKRGFTQREHVYSIWRYVVNQQVYDELCQRMCRLHGVCPEDEYFPLYRHPAFHQASARGAAAAGTAERGAMHLEGDNGD